eukprot:m.809427 g.809427  ORF g.809427 m.809427 type:complete len:198 (+) comp23383_c1_seq13:305-898(+)
MVLFGWCCPCLGYYTDSVPPTRLNERLLPEVLLDLGHCGEDAVLVKGGTRICGTGAALSNAPLVQNKSFWEVKLQTSGEWCIGVASRHAKLDALPLGDTKNEWVLRSCGGLFHNGDEVAHVSNDIEEGDVIGVSYDHEQLLFYLNGERLEVCISTVRGSVFPVVGVDQGAILDVQFKDFTFPSPGTYQEIMIEQNLL